MYTYIYNFTDSGVSGKVEELRCTKADREFCLSCLLLQPFVRRLVKMERFARKVVLTAVDV